MNDIIDDTFSVSDKELRDHFVEFEVSKTGRKDLLLIFYCLLFSINR